LSFLSYFLMEGRKRCLLFFLLQSRKDKERPKLKHKKRSESPTSLTLSSTTIVTEKVNRHHSESSAEAAVRSEGVKRGKENSVKRKNKGFGREMVSAAAALAPGFGRPPAQHLQWAPLGWERLGDKRGKEKDESAPRKFGDMVSKGLKQNVKELGAFTKKVKWNRLNRLKALLRKRALEAVELPCPFSEASSTIAAVKQSSTNHHESSKETSEVVRSEVKGKKSSSHGTSHKAKKSGSGKSSTSFGSSSSSGTFPPAGTSCSSLPFSQDFVTFPKLEQLPPEEEKYRKPVSSSSSSAHCSPLYEGQKSDVFEQKVIFSGFGSIMRFSTSAVSQQRGRDTSPVDYKASNSSGGPPAGSGSGSGSSHKRMPSLSMEEGEVLKEKKHKASKKSKHGPGRPKGSKNKEVLGAQLVGSTVTSSSPFSGGSLVSSSIGGSSRTFSHAATLPSLSMESPLLGSGKYHFHMAFS
ncbi:Protein AF-17, partial [Varanus komodoensis]